MEQEKIKEQVINFLNSVCADIVGSINKNLQLIAYNEIDVDNINYENTHPTAKVLIYNKKTNKATQAYIWSHQVIDFDAYDQANIVADIYRTALEVASDN